MCTLGSTRAATACSAWALPISPPSAVTAALLDMFCGLNGRTFSPRLANARARPVAMSDLSTFEPVPCSMMARVTSILSIDDMSIGTHDPADSETRGTKALPPCIAHGEEMIAADRFGEGRIMKLVAAQSRWKGQGSIVLQNAVAKRQLLLGEARCVRQQRRHGMGLALGIGDIAAEHHEATALAIDQCAPRRRLAKAVEEIRIQAELGRMQLGIAARQKDGIGIGRRRLVCERREKAELRAQGAPACQDMLIGEPEGLIARDGDALPERRQELRKFRLDRERLRQ